MSEDAKKEVPREVQVQLLPLVELPSGVCLRPENVLFIVRKEINQYSVFLKDAPVMPHITGADLDVLRDIGIVQRVVTDAEAKPEEDRRVVL